MAKKGFGIAGMLGEPRSGYNGGGGAGYQDYWTMVQESFSNAGGQDGTGMNIQDFAEMYFPRPGQAEGGRIGLADGDTPSQAWMRDYFYDAGYDDIGVITLDEYMNGPIGKTDYANHGPGKAEGGRIGYDNGGPVTQEDYDAYVAQKESEGEEPMDFETFKIFKIEFPGLAQGGRIGFKEGEGIMSRTGNMVDVRNIPYYAGKGLQGLVNSAETLSKFPFAAGELGSKLIQQPPKKEMFMEAIEDITPGSWSENLGLTSLVEGMGEKRPKDAQTVGNILGLGTEIAVPTGGAFKAGQILLSKASKLMGKVKDGKTLNKLVDQKLTDAGQSRRDFNIMAITSGLGIALKSIGLGGLFKAATKKLDDIEIQVRGDADYEYIDEGWEGGTWANVYFNALTKKGQKILDKLLIPKAAHHGSGNPTKAEHLLTYQDGLYVPGNSEEAAMVVQKLIAGHKPNWRLNTATKQIYDKKTRSFVHPKGSEKGAYEHSKIYSGKDLNKKNIIDEVDDLIASEPSPYHTKVEVHDEYFDDILDQITTKKAEGGRIGLGTGGLADMLGERTGFAKGKGATKKPRKPKKTMTIEEAIEDINKKLRAPDITDDESIRLRVILHDLILGPGMGGPRGDKIYQSKEDLPEGILEMLQKDPAFDFEKFSEIEWSPEGLRWTDKGQPGEGMRGSADGTGIWSGMAPFGETVYMDEGRGPRNKNIHLKDLDKAEIVNHELRHNLMGEKGSPLHHTQPEWVKEYKGLNYLRSEDDKPIGTSGHELYNRFIDSRLFPGEEHPGPNAPYFDKILRDHWEPNFQKYKKGVKELKSKPEHLSAEGGRIGLQTGGPPITLQRPMFNDGGLTKTVPPERGPDPQGLPSALYNGIMRPRSY